MKRRMKREDMLGIIEALKKRELTEEEKQSIGENIDLFNKISSTTLHFCLNTKCRNQNYGDDQYLTCLFKVIELDKEGKCRFFDPEPEKKIEGNKSEG